MKRTQLFKNLLVGIILMFGGLVAKASHIQGGNITYTCLGNNQYEVSLTMFFDCGTYSINTTGFSSTITVTNDCGLANPTATLAYNTSLSNIEVSQLCPAQLPNSECASPPGTQPGVWQATWTGIITLPAACNSWHFWYSTCCWNNNTNTSGTPGQLYHTSLNNAVAPCDNSPFLAGQQIPYLCANQVNTYSIGANDPDGNTLVYSLVSAQEGTAGSPTSVPYNGGYSGPSPIPGITIDPNTGLITVNPGLTGNYIIQVNIDSYDANGNLIGTMTQQFQIVVVVCTNQVPTPSATLSNITGNVVQTGPTSLQVCEGNNFCFNFTISDPNPTVTMTVNSNIATIFPGATVNVTGNNPWTVNVCGLASPGTGGTNNILFNIQDDACPIPGMATLLVTMEVVTSTYAGPNDTICVGQSAPLQATGGSVFTWSVLSGTPITVPATFSCNPCNNPTATPGVTTTYVVTSDLTGGCVNTDTVTVFVVPAFSYTVTQSSPNTCLQEPVNISVVPTPAGAYTYSWSPASPTFTPANSATPTFTPSAPGSYTFYLDVGSVAGCHYDDSVTISVASAYSPNITVTATPDSVACGDLSQLQVDLGGGIPATCGLSLSGGCVGAITNMQLGTNQAQNTTYTYPTPFGNWYANEKHHFLYTAAELNAMGFIGGKINSIAFNVISLGGMTTYPAYTVKMACTGLTALPGAYNLPFSAASFSTVYGPANYTATTGINTINFATPYEWDGVSNILVEICYTWVAQYSYTTNCIVQLTNTPFTSSNWFNSDGTVACPAANIYGFSNTRPVTYFNYCPADPDTNAYTYQWTANPSTGGTVANPNNMTTMTQTNNPTYYLCLVTYIAGGCTDTAGVMVKTACNGCQAPNPTLTHLTCNGSNNGQILATMVGNTGPWTVNWTNSAGTQIQSTSNVTVSDQMTGLAAGVYTITIIDTAGCTKDTTVTLNEPPAMTLTAVPDALLCLDGTYTLSAVAAGGNGGPYTLAWDNGLVGNGPHTVNPNVPTCYVVNVTDPLGCTADDDTVCITYHPPLQASTSGSAQLCEGNTITISAGATGGQGAPYTFTWFQGSTQIGTGSTINVTPLVSGTQYCVEVEDACTTPADSACLITTFYPQPAPSFTSDTTSGCYPVMVNFTNTTNPALVASANWTFGDGGMAVGTPGVTYSYAAPNPNLSDCYDVTLEVTSPDGCIESVTVADYICVYDYPDPSFNWSPQPADIFDPEIQFLNMSSPDAITYNWTMFDTTGVNVLGTYTGPNPIHLYPNSAGGSYPVMLVVSNANGCVDTVTYTIIISDIFTLYVPNAFTPDGNGNNDIFLPRGESISADEFDLKVFDRWGNVVFHSTDFTKGWDGTHKNIKAKSDTYVWKLKVKSTVDGKKYERYGHVLLLR